MMHVHGLSLFLALLVFGQEPKRAPEYAERRIKAVFRDLCEFARDVDSGARTLEQAHLREGQPDGMLTEFRALAHTHPDLGTVIQAFLRSKEEPLMGRALAVLAVARPDSNEVAALMGKLYAEGLDPELAATAILGYSPPTEEHRNPTWRPSLAVLRGMKAGPGWKAIRSRDEFGRHRSSFQPESPTEVDLRPMLEGLLTFVSRPESGSVKRAALYTAHRISKRKEMTDHQRGALREAIERSYAQRDEGWMTALQFLSGNLDGREKVELDALKKGFPGLDIPRQIDVLDHIARRAPASVFGSPFADEFEKIVDHLAKPPKESGLQLGMAFNYIHAIRLQTQRDPELKNRLKSHPSSTLRQRLFLD